MITDLVATLCFAGFVLGGFALLAVEARCPAWRRLATSLFAVYVLGVSAVAGFGQRDLWPFAAWNLVAGNVPRPWTTVRLVAVDARGIEHPVDARAWEPQSLDELRGWLLQEFPLLDPAAQDRVLKNLLLRANAARARVRAGHAAGTNARYLGPLAAPLFLLHPRRWSSAPDVPADPFVELRLYHEIWDLDRRMRGEESVSRRLVRGFPRAERP